MAKASIELKPISKKSMRFGIRGTSPLIMHQWSEKAKQMMREKHAGKKTKTREIRDPEHEANEATYRTQNGEIGIPGMAFKAALVTAAHKDIGVEKTMVRKSLFLVTDDPNKVLPIDCAEPPTIREDCVRVGMGSADLRYRPEFAEWSCQIELEVDSQLMQERDVIALVDRAGFGVGICEWRPEKGGEYGRFEIDDSVPIVWK
jgi:hypothetical protein